VRFANNAGAIAPKRDTSGPSAAQLATFYTTVLWSSGDLSSGTIHDTRDSQESADDIGLLGGFLAGATPANRRGVYLNGDGIMEDGAINSDDGTYLYPFLTDTFGSDLTVGQLQGLREQPAKPLRDDPDRAVGPSRAHLLERADVQRPCDVLRSLPTVTAPPRECSTRTWALRRGPLGLPADRSGRDYRTLIDGFDLAHLRGNYANIGQIATLPATDFARMYWLDDALTGHFPDLRAPRRLRRASADLPGMAARTLRNANLGAYPNPSFRRPQRLAALHAGEGDAGHAAHLRRRRPRRRARSVKGVEGRTSRRGTDAGQRREAPRGRLLLSLEGIDVAPRRRTRSSSFSPPAEADMTRKTCFLTALSLLAPSPPRPGESTATCRSSARLAHRPRCGRRLSRAQRELPAGDVRHGLGRALELGPRRRVPGHRVGGVWDFDTDVAGTDSSQGWTRHPYPYTSGPQRPAIQRPEWAYDYGNQINLGNTNLWHARDLAGRKYRRTGVISAWHADDMVGVKRKLNDVAEPSAVPIAGARSAWCGLRESTNMHAVDPLTGNGINGDHYNVTGTGIGSFNSNPDFPGFCSLWDQLLYKDFPSAGSGSLQFRVRTDMSSFLDTSTRLGWFNPDPTNIANFVNNPADSFHGLRRVADRETPTTRTAAGSPRSSIFRSRARRSSASAASTLPSHRTR
jgi:hypothetical protein